MSPIVVLALLFIPTGCTIRDAYDPGNPEPGGLALGPSPLLSAPVADGDARCMGMFARRSYSQADRDGTQDLFCD